MRVPRLALAVAIASSSCVLPQEVAPQAPASPHPQPVKAPAQGPPDLHFLAPPAQWPARLHHTDANVVAAIETGLDWLRKHQDDDGHWDCDQFMKHDAGAETCTDPGNAANDIGITGLTVLAFAREGRPPSG